MVLLVFLAAGILPALMGAAPGAGEEAAADSPEDFGWLSIVPPVLAIGMALLTRQVIVALLLGVYCGALIVTGNPGCLLQIRQGLGDRRIDVFHPIEVLDEGTA